MEPTRELIDDIYRQRVLRAREAPPGEKLLDGPRLFDRACEWMKAGIRDQFPDASDERVRQILADRINRLRQIEEQGLYLPVEQTHDG